MASLQLNFTLRTSPNCKTVHLLGSWDHYKGQLPLSKDPSKSGAWKGSFKFSPALLKPGQRAWYYYIVDGYHASHNPSQPSTVEPTTNRRLNVLDVPGSPEKDKTSGHTTRASRNTQKLKLDVPRGRAPDPSKILSPKPTRPKNARPLSTRDFGGKEVIQALSRQFADSKLVSSFSDDDSSSASDSDSAIDSDASSDVPSLSSSRSSSSASSISSRPSSCCTCNRYGITRKGDRVKLDCGGSRCGSGSEVDDASCSESEHEKLRSPTHATRRQGIYIRHIDRGG